MGELDVSKDDDAEKPKPKPLKWIGASKDDLLRFPKAVRKVMGHALHLAQINLKAPDAKPLRGFGGASILEVVEDRDGETYRAVYTVKFRAMVYVLHTFQKKSKKGIAMPKHEIDLIKTRLKAAANDYEKHRKDIDQ
jgi:phage-related protein